MPRHAAFLRGVNLGGRRKAGGAELRAAFEELGFGEVHTFRNSGNVVFDAPRASRAQLTERIEAQLARTLGFDVAVILRTAEEIEAIAAHRPFPPAQIDATEGRLQVSLLGAKPSAAVRERVLARATEDDRLAFGDRELYWLPRARMSDSTLDLSAVEKLLGLTTMRTKGTLEGLAAKFFLGA